MRSYFSEKINKNEVESLEYNPYKPLSINSKYIHVLALIR